MEKAQGQLAGPVGQPHQQTAPAPKGDIRHCDLALYDHPLSGPERPERGYSRPVFVALGQEKQQVQRPLHAEPGQTFSDGGADAAQGMQIVGGLQGTRTASASTVAPRGRDATPIAARAG